MTGESPDNHRTVGDSGSAAGVGSWMARGRAGAAGLTTMWTILLQTIFYFSVGLALLGTVVWYAGLLSTAVTGGDLVIVPFTVADSRDEKDARGSALAKMLQARLQAIEYDLQSAQEQLLKGVAATMPQSGESAAGGPAGITSVVPPLFAAQSAALRTRLLEVVQAKIAVGGVEVGGLIPWFQRLLVNRRTLELTYYERETGAVVSGSLEALGLRGESLRVEVPKAAGKPTDLDEVASTVAAEIVRRRLSADPSNRVEALNTAEFRALTQVLNDAARLNRQVALGRLVRERFDELLTRIEPLAGEVRDWYQLQLLASSIAESADKPTQELAFLTNAKRRMEALLKDADRRSKSDLEKLIASVDARSASLQPNVAKVAQTGEGDARQKLMEDLEHANKAFNTLFGHDLKPLAVELLAPHEANAYSDAHKYYAPPAVAQLPEITWHNMSWAHLNEILPVYTMVSNEANGVIYAYSDILPTVIRQLEWVESPDSKSWDVYPGGVAWLEAAMQGRDFKLGDDKRPLRSLKAPGSAYNDKLLGKDPQIAHYKDFKPDLEVHAAAGLGGKAFYEAAQRVGVRRAVDIWIAALKQVAKQKPLTYPRWAAAVANVSGADRAAITDALHVVGLDGAVEEAAAGATTAKPRRRPTT